jgi:hypothetical protein
MNREHNIFLSFAVLMITVVFTFGGCLTSGDTGGGGEGGRFTIVSAELVGSPVLAIKLTFDKKTSWNFIGEERVLLVDAFTVTGKKDGTALTQNSDFGITLSSYARGEGSDGGSLGLGIREMLGETIGYGNPGKGTYHDFTIAYTKPVDPNAQIKDSDGNPLESFAAMTVTGSITKN